MLEVKDLFVSYGMMEVLHGVDIKVEDGELISVIGPNGAGKTTLIKSIMGLVKPQSGTILYDGQDITHLPAHKRASLGIGYVPEGRHVFGRLTVEENLTIGAYSSSDKEKLKKNIELVYDIFPRLAERKAAAESEYDATAAKLWDEYQLTVSQAEELCVEFDSLPALRAQVADLRNQIRALGNVNVSAIEEYQEVRERYDALSAQVADVEGSRNELTRMIASLSGQMKEIFTDSFRAINENFGRIFAELFGGGEASLVLEDESDVLSCGIGIQVAPPGKVIKNLEALSGGEQALVAISIYFAILAVNPAPFCILDEIEAALDDANVSRFAQYLRRVSDKTQFIVITHRRGTMEAANVLYGVTMQEDGVSKLLKLDLEQVDATLVS